MSGDGKALLDYIKQNGIEVIKVDCDGRIEIQKGNRCRWLNPVFDTLDESKRKIDILLMAVQNG